MNLDTVATVLMAIAPAVTSFLTIIACVIKIIKVTKNTTTETAKQIEAKTEKMKKSFDDIAIIKTKIDSIEEYLKKGRR